MHGPQGERVNNILSRASGKLETHFTGLTLLNDPLRRLSWLSQLIYT
jgi:hypothetical protein